VISFEMPSRIRELDLPPSDFGCLAIPNSVEVLTGMIENPEGQRRLLQFGVESRLREINLIEVNAYSGMRWIRHWYNVVFICLSEEVLRRFRCKFESF
jgi:hypothetical protein